MATARALGLLVLALLAGTCSATETPPWAFASSATAVKASGGDVTSSTDCTTAANAGHAECKGVVEGIAEDKGRTYGEAGAVLEGTGWGQHATEQSIQGGDPSVEQASAGSITDGMEAGGSHGVAGYAQDKKASGITFLNLKAGMGSLAGGLASSKAWWKKDTPDVSAGSSGYAYGQDASSKGVPLASASHDDCINTGERGQPNYYSCTWGRRLAGRGI